MAETASSVEKYYQIGRDELPLSCPMPDMPVWDMHPRVYLPLGERDEVRCPYCGALFRLKD